MYAVAVWFVARNMNPLIAICRIEVMRHLDPLDITYAVFHSHSESGGLVLLDGGS